MAHRDREYVESNVSTGMDWRNRVPNAPPNARSLGTMESNGDKLIANRMKNPSMSWTIRGAHRMVKVIQLDRNGTANCQSSVAVAVVIAVIHVELTWPRRSIVKSCPNHG